MEFSIIEIGRAFKKGNVKDEILEFRNGINLIEGKPNTGKTTWLQCLNFLLGAESSPEHYFPVNFLSKYRSIRGGFVANGTVIETYRDWTRPGKKSKVFLNDVPMDSEEFQAALMNILNIPNLKYPKTDPVSEVKAISLSFRMHFRHIYRQQKYWGDIVDRQPAGEFRACLLNFIGIAERIFTEKYYLFYELSDKLKKANEAFATDLKVLRLITPKLMADTYDKDTKQSVIDSFEEMAKKAKKKLNEANKDIDRLGDILFKADLSKLNQTELRLYIKEFGECQKTKGLMEERLRTFERLEPVVKDFHINKKNVEDLTFKIEPLYDHVKMWEDTTEIDEKLNTICRGMNLYLQHLNKLNPQTWRHGIVNMVCTRSYISLRIDNNFWSTILGGTDSLYFLLSYHYGLLHASISNGFNIPSLFVIDLPPDIYGNDLLKNESFVMQPFVELLSDPAYEHCQVIFSGHNPNDFKNCNRIHLSEEFLAVQNPYSQ